MPRKPTKTENTSNSEKRHSAVPRKAIAPVRNEVPLPVAATKAVADSSQDHAAVKTAIAGLRDLDADNARDAATTLGRLGDASAVEPLIDVVRNANGYFHSVVRAAAACSLGQLKDRRAVEALLQAVSDPIAEPSCEAIRALADLGDPRSANALIEVVRNRSGFYVTSVRRAAVLGLVKLSGVEANAELRAVAENQWEDALIREEAAAGIAKR
jgi:HEAT repeat protein